MHNSSPSLVTEMPTASGSICLELSIFLAILAGLMLLAGFWLARIIDAARAGAQVVSNTSSTCSFSSDTISAINSGLSPNAASTVFTTMRFVFIVPLGDR